jgi:hypothetical protein
MIRRLSCVLFWQLLLLAILINPGSVAADETSNATWWWRPLRQPAPTGSSYPATYAYNNLWNTRKARGSQSITVYDNDPVNNPLWSTTWDWKRGQQYTVTSYASMVTGWHWGEPFETPGLIPAPDPVSAGTPVQATVDYQYEPDAACTGTGKRAIICRYDVAYDLWFHNTNNPGTSSPVFELMVWLDYSWNDLWIGYTPIDTVEIPQGSQTFWKIFQTASTNAVFVPVVQNPVSGQLQLDKFIAEAIRQANAGKLTFSSSWYLSSVEFGIEVYQGKGKFTVNDYTLTIGGAQP